MEVSVDGRPVLPSQTFGYKGIMYEGVPNMASAFGYTNASWTLKCDLTCEFVCRVLNHMKKTGLRQATPVNSDGEITPTPWLDFSSGYVQRAMAKWPKQGDRAPWRLDQNYAKDLMNLRYAKLDDGTLRFTNRVGAVGKKVEKLAA